MESKQRHKGDTGPPGPSGNAESRGPQGVIGCYLMYNIWQLFVRMYY